MHVPVRQRGTLIYENLYCSIPAMGCADMQDDAEIEITKTAEKTAVAKCKETEYSWNLVCQDNRWIGDHRNCTEQTTESKSR